MKLGKAMYFNVMPLDVVIASNQEQTFIASFNPRSAGQF